MKDKKEFLLFQLKVEGFAFIELDMPKDLLEDILKIQFSYYPADPGEDICWIATELPSHVEANIRKWLKTSEELKDLVDHLEFNAHTFKKGEFLKMHNDAKDKGEYQLLIWACEDNQFIGREFLYGLDLDGNRQVNSKKVSSGLICVMDINNENFIHGVTALESDSKIITVQGYHGN